MKLQTDFKINTNSTHRLCMYGLLGWVLFVYSDYLSLLRRALWDTKREPLRKRELITR